MLAKKIEYTDWNGEKRTTTEYFNITIAEFQQWNLAEGDTLVDDIGRLLDGLEGKELARVFEKVLEMSYGVKSSDGKFFTKSPEAYAEFKATGAWHVMYVDLLSSIDAAAEFINGVFPKNNKSENEQLTREELMELMKGKISNV